MPLLHSEPEAALLEAGALSHRLAERYRLAAEQLAEHAGRESPQAAEPQLQQILTNHADVLEQQANRLDQTARSLDLLPRDPDTELESVKQLADQIQTLLEDQQGAALAQRFIEVERSLLEELETAAKLNPCPPCVTAGIRAGRERLGNLAVLA